MVKFHIGIQGHHAGEDIRKSKAGKNTSSHGCAVAHLHPYDMTGAFLENAAKILIQPLMDLQLAKGAHTPDPEFIPCLLNLIQSQARQVHNGTFCDTGHLQPYIAAHHQAAALLAQFISFRQTVHFYIIFRSEHASSPFLSCAPGQPQFGCLCAVFSCKVKTLFPVMSISCNVNIL